MPERARWLYQRRKPRRRINWRAVGLGEVTDVEIARELGLRRRTVLRARNLLGIPACKRVVYRDLVFEECERWAKPPREIHAVVGGSRLPDETYRALRQLRNAGLINRENARISSDPKRQRRFS